MADAVTQWNDLLLKVIKAEGGAPGPIARAGAMMHCAMYDAVNSIRPSTHRPYLVSVPAEPGASVRSAIAHAAHDTLVNAFSAHAAIIAAERTTALTGIPPGPRAAGEAVGKAAARAMIAARTNDGVVVDESTYTPGTMPGDWRPTGSGNGVGPYWSDVKPFVIEHGNDFRPPRPGGYATKDDMLKSSEYAAQVNEVMSYGGKDSTERTAEQTEIALFWANDLNGSYKPPGQLYEMTKIVALQKGLGIVENARLFALVALALADASIVAWDAKYETSLDLWRPESAINLADTDGNPATMKPPMTVPPTPWQPLSYNPVTKTHFSPPFPAYTSGHATFGAAHAAVMRRYFGTDNVTFTAHTDDPNLKGATPPVTRTFNSFTEAALENGRSRVYLGVHFQWDADHGFHSGNAVGEHVYDHALTPVGA